MSQLVGRWCELNNIPEEVDLQRGMDFRRPEFRREVFLRFYSFHLKHRAHPGAVYFMMPYLAEKYSLSVEDKLWLAYINGCTQHIVTSWLIFQNFPSIQNIDLDALLFWFNKEFSRLGWDTDRRHQKAQFVNCVMDYKRALAGSSQQEFFHSLASTPDEYENFRRLWKAVRETFFSFGRLSTFSYLEYLRIMGLPIDCDDLFFEDLEGSKSHRNGLAKVLGRDDLDWHLSNPDFKGKYAPEQLAWLKTEGEILLQEAKERFRGKSFERDVSYSTLESTLCCFKSWFRPNRRYPGVYLDMFHDRIKRMEQAWPEEDFSIFWEARKSCLPIYLRLEDNPADVGLKSKKQNWFRETGQTVMMDQEWSAFKNSYNDEVYEKQGGMAHA